MRVESALLNHPKYLALVAILGEQAMHYLVAVWAHCSEQQRGEFWEGKDGRWLEMVARWKGEPGQLFSALRDCGGEGRVGFVSEEPAGLRIHQWNEFNSQTVKNWWRNRSGRPDPTGQPKGNPTGPPMGVSAIGGSSAGSNGHGTHAPIEQSKQPDPPLTPPRATPRGPHGGAQSSILSLPSFPSLQPGDQEAASALVEHLNRLTGAHFNLPFAGLDQVLTRYLETNRDRAGIEAMLARQVALWQSDAKMRQWLKPSTLFGEKFHEYYGQRELPAAALSRAQLTERILKNPANRESTYHSRDASAADKAQLAADRKALEACP